MHDGKRLSDTVVAIITGARKPEGLRFHKVSELLVLLLLLLLLLNDADKGGVMSMTARTPYRNNKSKTKWRCVVKKVVRHSGSYQDSSGQTVQFLGGV